MLDSFLRLHVGQPQIPGQGSAPAVPYPRHRQGEIGEAIREAWAWLEGQGLLLPSPHHAATTTIRVLSRRARRISQQSDPRKVLTHRTIPKATQHPAIREDVWASYTRGRFGTAVFEAMVAVEVAVREASGITGLGVPLMRDAFKPQGGPLADMNSDMGEREARSALFAGAIGAFKNPHSHRKVDLDDPDEAAEIIMLANLLLRIVDGRRPS